MAKTKISEWDSNPNNNTDIDSINIAEGCAPSGINNAIRELMSQVKDFQQGTYSDPFNGPVNGTVGATTPAAGAFTTLAASDAVTLSGGTANGVPYLNGSKVLTSGSALTFNGSTFGVAVSGSTDALRITQTGTGNAFVVEDSASPDSTPFVITNNGSVVIGGTSPEVTYTGGTRQITQLAAGPGVHYLGYSTGSTTSGNINFSRTRGASPSDRTIVADGDWLGLVAFSGADGAALVRGAQIVAEVDGTPGTNDMPGRLVFSTTADGASSPTERMRIDSSGNLGLGVTPSAWSSGYKVFQLGAQGSLASGSNITQLSTNYYRTTGLTDAYIANGYATKYQQEDGAHKWYTAPSGTAGNAISFTQAMTLDASGQLLLGTTSASLSAAGRGNITLSGSSSSVLVLNAGGSDGGWFYADSTQTALSSGSGRYLNFQIGGTERARITSGGHFLIGNTDNLTGKPAGVINPIGYVGRAGTSGSSANVFNIYWTGSAQLWIDTTNIGNIQVSSDYRIKKNIATQTAPAIERVMQLRPVTYELANYGDLFKEDGIEREGFIAHEVQAVIPSGAEGQKDEEGRIQNLRVDAIVSVLTKAIQEQQAIINDLKARLDAANL